MLAEVFFLLQFLFPLGEAVFFSHTGEDLAGFNRIDPHGLSMLLQIAEDRIKSVVGIVDGEVAVRLLQVKVLYFRVFRDGRLDHFRLGGCVEAIKEDGDTRHSNSLQRGAALGHGDDRDNEQEDATSLFETIRFQHKPAF